MLNFLSPILRAAKRFGILRHCHIAPTHNSMLREHEKRKGEELHRRLTHEQRYQSDHNV